MRMARSLAIVVGGMALALAVTGCTDPRDLQISDLNARVQELERENSDLRSRLARCTSDRDAALARAAALEQQLRELQDQLSKRTPVEQGPEGWQQSGDFSWINIGTDFLFDSGKATLRSAGREKLQQIVGDINSHYANKMIWVVGHTDGEPITKTKHLYKDNLDLSLTRGATVFRELQGMGITPQRMVAGGQGEYNPVASNDARGRSQQNRRVTIIAVPMPGSLGVAPGGPGLTPTDSSRVEPESLDQK